MGDGRKRIKRAGKEMKLARNRLQGIEKDIGNIYKTLAAVFGRMENTQMRIMKLERRVFALEEKRAQGPEGKNACETPAKPVNYSAGA